jgi:hypothetical protein
MFASSMKSRILLTIFFLLFLSTLMLAQKAKVFGVVSDLNNKQAIEFATVYIEGSTQAVETNAKGFYELEVPAEREFKLVISRIGYQATSYNIRSIPRNTQRQINVLLAIEQKDDFNIVITESKIEDVGMIREEVESLKLIPSSTGNFESILPNIALGTSVGTGGELSSQYNVRGGNYDENLVYINDFEVFRPQLIKSGQQEGLSFPNIDLLKDLTFSSGGFEAKYGDKMSSVLDVHYKLPDSLAGSASLSVLGATAHFEGSSQLGKHKHNKLRFLLGARYKTTQYLLNSLEIKGEYTPNFADVQSYVTYDISKDFQIAWISNYNSSIFELIPQEQANVQGLFNQAIKFSSVFEGREEDAFRNGMTGLALTYIPDRKSKPLYLKLLGSTYLGYENENLDILGTYRLSEIETSLGSEQVEQEIAVLGLGKQQEYTRNFLFTNINNVKLLGGIELPGLLNDAENESTHFLQAGLKYQREFFYDKINEWERIDSADYSLPFSEDAVLLNYVLQSQNEFTQSNFSLFVQDSYSYLKKGVREMRVSGGLRLRYNDINEEWLWSPRFQFSYKPLQLESDIAFKIAGGVYYQPPFYRERRRTDGSLNFDLFSQKSIHFVGGMSYDFYWKNISNKKMRFISEIYYKSLSNLISYEQNNVNLDYSGENDARGYVMGLDMRINGEFVPGAESWINLSFLRSREALNGVEHLVWMDTIGVVTEDVPRATDRFMSLTMFFQDYLPQNENFKVHVNLNIGTGLPYGQKGYNEIYRNAFRYPPYHRIDIGFSYLLWDSNWAGKRPKHPLRFTRNTWLSLEVFNLMKVSNVASNTWIKAINNFTYPIRNRLTSRRFNLKLKIDI